MSSSIASKWDVLMHIKSVDSADSLWVRSCCTLRQIGLDKGRGGTLTLKTDYCWQHIHTVYWFHVCPITNLSPSVSPSPCYNFAAIETIVFTPQRISSVANRKTNTHMHTFCTTMALVHGFCVNRPTTHCVCDIVNVDVVFRRQKEKAEVNFGQVMIWVSTFSITNWRHDIWNNLANVLLINQIQNGNFCSQYPGGLSGQIPYLSTLTWVHIYAGTFVACLRSRLCQIKAKIPKKNYLKFLYQYHYSRNNNKQPTKTRLPFIRK